MNKEDLKRFKEAFPEFRVRLEEGNCIIVDKPVIYDEYVTPLFIGDRYWWVDSLSNPLKCISNDECVISSDTKMVFFGYGVKIFATKEAAEKWIKDAESKQPKEVVNVRSQAECDFVSKRLGYVWKINIYDLFGTTSCINLHKNRSTNIDCYKTQGYKILSFDEWCEREGIENPFKKPKYEPKGQLKGFPIEVIKKMLKRQKQQTGEKDVTVFEKNACAGNQFGGFNWDSTKEKHNFWHDVIHLKRFDKFFERYPKKKNKCGLNGRNIYHIIIDDLKD